MTNKKNIAAVILAAGEGKRLKYRDGKPLAPVVGKKLIDFPITEFFRFTSCLENCVGKVSVVVGHQKEKLISYLDAQYAGKLSYAVQKKQLGTADAIRAHFYDVSWASSAEYTFVLCADTPLIRSEDLAKLMSKLEEKKLDAVAATFCLANPTGYGRIIRSDSSQGFSIVEEKDASSQQKSIKEVNSGLYLFKTSFLLEQLTKVQANNKANEFYLTDVFSQNHKVSPLLFDEADKFLGVNNLQQLEEADLLLRLEKVSKLRELGVRFIDSKNVFIDWDVKIDANSTIYPSVSIQGNSQIGEDVVVENGSIIKNSLINNSAKINAYSYLEDVVVRCNASIGPFARLRPGTDVGEDAKIGNFVETKKAILEKGVKISHLSYVGDAEIGPNSNIGCGFITCNYDGANKHKTVIGENTFIGSDCQVVAPVKIGNSSFVAAGSTITEDIPDGAFAVARSRQTNKEGMAKRFIKKKK